MAIVVPGAAAIGTLIGLVSGWRAGLVGNLLMRLTDIPLALPSILFAVLLGSILGPSLRNVIILLLLWTGSAYARLVRAETISLRERDFMVQAWWMIWLSGIALMVVSFTGNLMGDWLRDALDPRLRHLR